MTNSGKHCGKRRGNFFFCHYVFKKPSAAEVSESVHMRERIKPKSINIGKSKPQLFPGSFLSSSSIWKSLKWSCSVETRENYLVVNKLEHLTLSHIHQICSRWLWKNLPKMWKISSNKGIITEKKLKTLWQKEKLLVLSNFFFFHNVFKSRLLQMRQNASTGGKGFKKRI